MRGHPLAIAIVGGGPAGLMAAEVLAAGGATVTVYEGMPTLGRKLLLAGRGGLNLTHGEDLQRFLSRYGEAAPRLREAIEALPPDALRAWADGLGQATFVGSSGRVFPRAMKASPLLRAWLARLDAAGVRFQVRHRWTGWDERGRLRFAAPAGTLAVEPAATVLALGGASWPRLGSDGAWVAPLAAAGIGISPLQPANCGFVASWSELFASRFAGAPLKRIALTFGDVTIKGEAVVTRAGIEGGGVYALAPLLRDAIHTTGVALLGVDLRPDLTEADLARRLAGQRGKQSLATFLRKTTGLPPVAIGLLHEATMQQPGRLAGMSPDAIAGLIKAVPVRLTGIAPIERAISTAGGVAFEEVDDGFMLTRLPGVFVAGEMLDWEAPTGGYLLQAAFATGAAAGRGASRWLAAGAR